MAGTCEYDETLLRKIVLHLAADAIEYLQSIG